jgi:hypothetical protein
MGRDWAVKQLNPGAGRQERRRERDYVVALNRCLRFRRWLLGRFGTDR